MGLTGAPQSPKARSLPLFRCRQGSVHGSPQGVPKVPSVQFSITVTSVTWGEGPAAAAGLVTPASTQHLQGVDPAHGEVSRTAPSPDGDTGPKGSAGQRPPQGWATALTCGVRGQVSLGSNMWGWASGLWAARREPGHPSPWDSLVWPSRPFRPLSSHWEPHVKTEIKVAVCQTSPRFMPIPVLC